MDISVLILIASDKQNKFKEYKNYSVNIKKKVDEGASGKIYMMDNGEIMKIYKNSIAGFALLQESDNLIPKRKENREIPIFLKIIKDKENKYKDVITPYAIGIIKHEFIIDNEIIRKNTYFSLMPYYELIKKHDLNKYSILDLLYKISKAEHLLEKYFNIIHCDINIKNIVVEKDNFMLIDYELIKTIKNKVIDTNGLSKIWPKGPVKMDCIPVYSIAIMVVGLLIGASVYTLSNKEIMHKLKDKINEDEYNYLYNCLCLKYNSFQLINKILTKKINKNT
jgi:tRNA A-37 threonylcarbamoyl transferase component Bud32